MAAPVIAIATEDFSVYHDLAKHLRARNIPFVSLAPGATVPGHVSVVVTTEHEAPGVPHPNVVLYTTPDETIEEIARVMKGLRNVRSLVIGIDPGERPGVAVVADGHILSSKQLVSAGAVLHAVRAIVERYDAPNVVVRVGHGAATMRDRIVNDLLRAGLEVELVDETSTSPPRARVAGERDAAAARLIALSQGTTVRDIRIIHVPPGEIRDIQRKSRLMSGDVTISRQLAGRVARGKLSLGEAVTEQRRKRRPARRKKDAG